MFANALNCLLQPEGRLEPNFPWGWKTAGKRYAMATINFAVGSFALPLLFLGLMAFLVRYESILLTMQNTAGTINALIVTGIIGWLVGQAIFAFRARSRNVSLAMLVAGSFAYGAAGASVISFGFLALMAGLRDHYWTVMETIINAIADANGQPKHSFIMGMSFVSFVMGFGMEINYIRRALKADGHSLKEVMGLTLAPRKGRNVLHTAWRVIWPVALTYGIWLGLENIIVAVAGHVEQPTVDLARQVTGGNFILFALMAAVGAPIFEEIVFRGFLFQVLRSSLRREAELPQFTPVTGWFAVIRNLAGRVRFAGAWAVAKLHALCQSRPDFWAVIISSAAFSLMHMQFHPVTMVSLFLLGALHCEIYRRTGSLYCSMLLHAVNNGLAVILIALS